MCNEMVVFYCSCGEDIGPFCAFRGQLVICGNCCTHHTYTDKGLRSEGRLILPLTPDYARETTHSHAINLEYPA